MLSLVPLLLILIPLALVIVAGMLIRKRGNPDTAGQRYFLFLAWTTIAILIPLLIYWFFIPPGFEFIRLFIPIVPALTILVFLHSYEWRNLQSGQRKSILFAVALIILLVIARFLFVDTSEPWQQLEGLLQGLTFLSIPLFVYIVWIWGNRFPILFGGIAILYLVIFNWFEWGAPGLLDELSPDSLVFSSLVILRYLTIPGFVLPTLALLVLNTPGTVHGLDTSTGMARASVIGRLLMSLILLGGFLFTYIWLWVWDGVNDGVRFLLLMMAAVITVVALALVIGVMSSGWRRWVGVPFAVLVVPLLYGGVLLVGNKLSNYSITEARARQIQSGIEKYHEKTSWYPLSLAELTPGTMLRIPLPMVIEGQNWCYQAGSNYYRLGLVYREHWSSPYYSVRVYASAGNIPEGGWECDEELAELRDQMQVAYTVPPPTVYSVSTVSVPRSYAEPILSGTSFAVGDWSPDGRYLVFGQTEFFMEEVEQVKIDLHFIDSATGDICQPVESQQTAKASDGLRGRYAWLPDGRFLYVEDSGKVWTFTPCAGNIEDVSSLISNRLTGVVSFHAQSGKVLVRDEGGMWLLAGTSFELRKIVDVPTESYWDWYAWSADGKHLAISILTGAEEGEPAYLYVINAENGEVELDMPLLDVSDANLPLIEWLTPDVLLLHSKTLTVLDFRANPPVITDLVHDVFLLDIEYPNDISSMDSHPSMDGFAIGLRVNHLHNQGAYVYNSTTGQVIVYEHDTHSLFFLPDGGWMRLPEWEDVPSYTDEYEMIWIEQSDEARRLEVEGHVPRSYPQLSVNYLPETSQLVFNSSQGVSLVSIAGGETVRFWQLRGAEGLMSMVYPSPMEDALVVFVNGVGLYHIPLPSQ